MVLITRCLVALVLLLAGCATDDAPAGFKAYCDRYPERQECGGTK